MRRTVVITEVKTTVHGARREFACRLLDRSAHHVAVFYPVTRKGGRRVGDLLVPRGTESYGYFWRDRPYTVYHWVTPGGRTLGFYVNLADQIQFSPHEVRWRDLALDLLFSADGNRVQVLDEEEVADLPEDLQAKIASARAHVLARRDDLLQEVRAATAHLRQRVRSRT